MESRQIRGTHPALRSSDPVISVVRDDPWDVGFAPTFEVESSTFLDDRPGPLATITPLRPPAPSRRRRVSAAVARVVDYLVGSLELLPEHFDF